MASKVTSAAQWATGAEAPYWEALADGVLALQKCAQCQRWHWPAVWRCGDCGSWEHVWEAVEPTGRVFSWTRTHHKFDGLESLPTPFVIAVVELPKAGGVRLTGLMKDNPAHIHIGADVRGVPGSTVYAGAAVPAWHWATT